MYLLQYNRGRYRKQRWVFGIVNIGENPAKPVYYYVPKRDRVHLMPIIQRHCPPGSTIVSDQFRAYMRLPAAGYLHLTVNHSVNFVDRYTGESIAS